MQLLNDTNWNTGDLKKFVRVCFKKELVDPNPYHIFVSTRRANSRTWGRAPYHYKRVSLYLQPCERGQDPLEDAIDMATLAHVICHEIAHTQGITHGKMKGTRYAYPKGWEKFYEWARDYIIRPKLAPALKVKPDIRQVRYERAKTNLKKAETRLKRAKTLHKKWKDKVTYYEKRQ